MMTSPTKNTVASTKECVRLAGPSESQHRKLEDFGVEATPVVEQDCVAPALDGGFPAWKRALDLCLVFVGLPLWLPVALVVGVIVRLGSRGPIFFCQERVGQGGRLFTCFKFRTMRMNASSSAHQNHVKDLIRSAAPMVKLDAGNDTRVIPGGAWIRASGLDELPQIINILRGEMSLVGPRPCIPYEYNMYEPWQRRRCAAPPGLTGLWQVSGKNRTTFNRMVELDISYAQKMSPWLDLGIVVRTPLAILQQVVDARIAKRARREQVRSKVFVGEQLKF